MSEMSFAGKVVLVTGAGRGAGRKLAEAFANQGALVAANDITPVNVEKVVEEIITAGWQARAYIHDIAKKVDIQAMVNNIVDDWGRIDILINSANVLLPAALLEIDEWDLHRVFEVNTIGTLLVMQSVGRVMRAQGGGTIINVVKIPKDAPASFVASRAGLSTPDISNRISEELGGHGIHVFTLTSQDMIPAAFAACKM